MEANQVLSAVNPDFPGDEFPVEIDYEVRDKMTRFLTRNPPSPYIRKLVEEGDLFVEAGPSRIMRFNPKLAEYSKNPTEGYPNGLRGRVCFYFDGQDRLHRGDTWQHPRINGGEPMPTKFGPAVEFEDPDLAAKFNVYAWHGIIGDAETIKKMMANETTSP
jgi:hypothetical protein